MNYNGRPPIFGFSRWKWFAGTLLVAILIIVGCWLRPSPHLVAAPLPVAEVVHPQAPRAVKTPVITDQPKTLSAVNALDICGIGKVPIDAASPHYQSASKHCSADAMHDEDVRQQCNSLAELMVSKGTTLVDLGIGANIGARVGWPKTRVAALADERDAMMWSMEAASTDNEQPWTCDAVRRGNAYVSEWVRRGELGVGRDSIERSGETVSALAQKHRDYMDKIGRDFQRREETSPSAPPP